MWAWIPALASEILDVSVAECPAGALQHAPQSDSAEDDVDQADDDPDEQHGEGDPENHDAVLP